MRVFLRLFPTVFVLAIVFGLGGAMLPLNVYAQSQTTGGNPTAGYNNIITEGIIFANMADPGEECQEHGKCTLDQILQVFVNIVTFILGISGSIVLLMFVYGGFLWVTSRGEAKHVQEGKDTMVRAMLGFAIIVLSYSLINFLIAAVVGDNPFDNDSLEQTVDDALDKNVEIRSNSAP